MKTNVLFFIISRSVLLRMRNVSDKILEKIKTHFILINIFFFENHALYKIMRNNNVESDTSEVTMWPVRIGWCIPRATNTHSEYVILNDYPL
jgi:hypothetical protein